MEEIGSVEILRIADLDLLQVGLAGQQVDGSGFDGNGDPERNRTDRVDALDDESPEPDTRREKQDEKHAEHIGEGPKAFP